MRRERKQRQDGCRFIIRRRTRDLATRRLDTTYNSRTFAERTCYYCRPLSSSLSIVLLCSPSHVLSNRDQDRQVGSLTLPVYLIFASASSIFFSSGTDCKVSRQWHSDENMCADQGCSENKEDEAIVPLPVASTGYTMAVPAGVPEAIDVVLLTHSGIRPVVLMHYACCLSASAEAAHLVDALRLGHQEDRIIHRQHQVQESRCQ